MQDVPPTDHPDVLVGPESWDDAGVYRLSDEVALVQTVDFFTPIVDDPHDFGRVAAANALSDVYAMGGEPLTALGVVAFPLGTLPLETLSSTLRGAQQMLSTAGVPLVGGHTVKDKEFKVGFAVTGRVHPQRIITNAGAQVGDRLLLTKPLGTGVLSTAVKRDRLDGEEIARLVAIMSTLNRDGAEAMQAAGAHAATDITGFGLMGHAASMARSSQVSLSIDFGRVPLIDGALELLRDGIFPGGLRDNLRSLAGSVRADTERQPDLRLLFDPQTSGGLLVALAPEGVETFQAALAERGAGPAAEIGRVVERGETWVAVDG
jgi:selenide,water dikinase